MKNGCNMNINFFKYQGAGNDFVFLDNFSGQYDNISLTQIQEICNRKFGIGADGLIKIDLGDDLDFHMDYYNSDGSKSFCGNGARCAVRFVNEHLLKKDQYEFSAIDGVHEATLLGNLVSLQMHDVKHFEVVDEDTYVINAGSPHFIHFMNNIADFDIFNFGRKIRYSEKYKEAGINVNVVEVRDANQLSIRTYERGVEDETLACGTGITAAAIAYAHKINKEGDAKVALKAMGGELSVHLHKTEDNRFIELHLIGPAEFVFEGKIDV